MLLFLVRHAESKWNRVKKIQGQQDPHLSPFGRKEAMRLAKRFEGLKFTAVYASTLARAYETAEVIVGAKGRITLEDGLKEMSLGKWEGKTIPEVRKAYGDIFIRWASRPSRVQVPGGEDFKDFVARVKTTLRAIERRHRSGNVLVVCHGGVISTYATVLLNLPPDDTWCLGVNNASLTIIDVAASGYRLVTFNDISHLMSLRDLKRTAVTHVD